MTWYKLCFNASRLIYSSITEHLVKHESKYLNIHHRITPIYIRYNIMPLIRLRMICGFSYHPLY